MEHIFDTVEIANNIYRIREYGLATCYLVLGTEKALLIDSGNGAGNIRKEAEKITSLPITLALTHGHPDHSGGLYFFDEAYLTPQDYNLFFKLTIKRFVRYITLLKTPGRTGKLKYHIVAKTPRKTKILPLLNNHVFDLGGRRIQAITLPGHTQGSTIFVSDDERIIFTGDNVCKELWMFLPGSSNLETWLVGAVKVLEYANKGYSLYCGHNDGLQNQTEIEDLIQCAKSIFSQEKKNSKRYKVKSFPKNTPIRIIYRSNKIFKSQK